METERDTQWDLEVSRVMKAPVALVFRAWTDMEEMAKWLSVQDWTFVLTGEFVEGGHVVQEMVGTNMNFVGAMEPIQIIENKKIVMRAWWEEPDGSEAEIQTVTVTFEDLGDNTTKLTYHNTFEKEDSMGRDENAFIGTLEMFANYIEPIASAS